MSIHLPMKRDDRVEEKHFLLHDEKRTHMPRDTSEWECLRCHRRFPVEYPFTQRSRKVCGARQLMRIYATNNFRKHLKSCWAKAECWLCGGLEAETTIIVERETPGGEPCKAKEVQVHFGCYMDIED